MFDQTTLRGRILAASMKLAAQRPWQDVTLLDIAEDAGVSLVDVRQEFTSKSAIIAAFVRAVDDEVLRRAPKRDRATGHRDALFEIIMTRFDVLAPYRDAVRSISRGGMAMDPTLACSALSSQHWMLQGAGIDTKGATGGLKVAGLATVYASVMRTWLSDDDPGLARTMAALDRRLRRGERAMSNIADVQAGLRRMAETIASFGTSRRKRRGGDAAETPKDSGPAGATDPVL